MLQQSDQDHQEKQEHMPMGGHLFHTASEVRAFEF